MEESQLNRSHLLFLYPTARLMSKGLEDDQCILLIPYYLFPFLPWWHEAEGL